MRKVSSLQLYINASSSLAADVDEGKFLYANNGPSRKRGSLKRTYTEVVKIDLKKCILSKDLALDRLE